MPDQANVTTPEGDGSQSSADRKAIEAVATLLDSSMKQLAGTNDAQQTAILALTALVALSPATSAIETEKLAVILELLTRGRPDSANMRKRVANYVSLVVGISTKLPGALAEAREKRDAAKGSPADGLSVKADRVN